MASLHNLTVDELRRELARREKGSSKLVARHRKLAAKLAALDAELAELGVAPARRGRKPGAAGGRRGPRAKNSMSLLQAIVSSLRAGSTVSPAEAGAAAKKAGYNSSSPNFGMMVANALAKASEFKRTGRGQYLFKGASAKAGKPAKAKRGRKAGRRAAKKSAKNSARKAPRKVRVAKAAPAKPAAKARPTVSGTSQPVAAAAAG